MSFVALFIYVVWFLFADHFGLRQIQTGDEDEDELDTFKGPVF